MQARIKFSILDHYYNTQSKQVTTKDGTKLSKLEDKFYMHFCYIMEDVVKLRLDKHQCELFDYNKPNFIPHNMASKEWPPKQDVVEAHNNNSQQ